MKKIVNPQTGEETVVRETADGLVRSKLKSKSKPRQKPRDINEDDDGYHPYSDRMPDVPLFEENPWR